MSPTPSKYIVKVHDADGRAPNILFLKTIHRLDGSGVSFTKKLERARKLDQLTAERFAHQFNSRRTEGQHAFGMVATVVEVGV